MRRATTIPATASLALAPGSLQPRPSLDSWEKTKRNSKRVLVFDEDGTLRHLIVQMLSFLGYQGVTTQHSQEVVRLYCQALHTPQSFAAVILDLTVQNGHGACELLAILQAYHPQVRAIVASGYLQSAELLHFGHYGFAGALGKPFTLNEFAETVLQAMTGAQQATGAA